MFVKCVYVNRDITGAHMNDQKSGTERRSIGLGSLLLTFVGGIATAVAGLVVNAAFEAARAESPDQTAARADVETLRPLVASLQERSDKFGTSAELIQDVILKADEPTAVVRELGEFQTAWEAFLRVHGALQGFETSSSSLAQRLATIKAQMRKASSTGQGIQQCVQTNVRAYGPAQADIMARYLKYEIPPPHLRCADTRRPQFLLEEEIDRFDNCQYHIAIALDGLISDTTRGVEDSLVARWGRTVGSWFAGGQKSLNPGGSLIRGDGGLTAACEDLDAFAGAQERQPPFPWGNRGRIAMLEDAEATKAPEALPGPQPYAPQAPQVAPDASSAPAPSTGVDQPRPTRISPSNPFGF